jgi:hypothetical protein
MTIQPLLRAPTDPADPQALVIADLQQRVGRIERYLGDYGSPVGFHVVRTSNEATWASNTVNQITFTNIRSNEGFLPSTFGGSSSFVVPANLGGVYTVNAGVYWATALSQVFVSIRVNGGVVVAHDAGHAADRRYIGAQPLVLKGGDTIDVTVWNLSGVNLTVTAYPGDGTASPPLPYLSVWRVA